MPWITVKKLDVMSVAKIYGIMGVIIGFILGLILAFMGTAAGIAGVPLATGFGIAMIIIMPVIYGILLFICGAIGALIYNVIAGWIGGVRFWSDSRK